MMNGMPVTIERAIEALSKYRHGLKVMAGGFTLSGGEPLMQHRFAAKVLTGAKKMGIHTTIETNGFNGDKLSDAELESIDLVMLGLKTWDPARHKALTGMDVAWIVIGCLVTLLLIGYFDMWDDTMRTISMIFVCTVLSIAIGLPIGILMSRSDRVQRVVNPVLDVMQTMPSFVYLIPVVMLLGIGKVPGLIAVVIYAIPPMIRLTNLGIRLVDKDVLEAADAFGSSGWQKLKNVQMPLALPTIMAGINQTIMMALAMVVIASMIGVQGLGQPVLKAIANQYFTLGIFNGLAIVGIAIIFDRVSQAYGHRLQKHREIIHG